MIVLVNPITKKPTAFACGDTTPQIFAGPYQNVAEVTEEWVDAERKRLGNHVLENYELWSHHPDHIREAIAAERERCARVVETLVKVPKMAKALAAFIRCGK